MDQADIDDKSGKRKVSALESNILKKVKYEDILSKGSNTHKPPTVEELNEFKETQNLYNNNLFRLQIEEILKEVIIKNKTRKVFTEWLRSFEEILDKLPSHTITLSKIKKQKGNSEKAKLINSFLNADITTDQDLTLNLDKPECYEIFGLDSINSLPGPKLTVNMNLKMPKTCFNEKDHLNNRYFLKRYYFLAYVNFYLEKNNYKVQWILHNNNNQLPILGVVLLDNKVNVNIHATPTEDYFKIARCGADINNVKINVFDNAPLQSTSPTLFYNASLAHDLTLSRNNNFVKNTLNELTNIQEAIKLICIWAFQRNLYTLSEELISYFLCYLVIKRRVNKHMSSYQVVRYFWSFLRDLDLTKNAISLCENVLECFQNNYEVTFLDITGYFNITAFLNNEMFNHLKFEAARAFRLLDKGDLSTFHSLFISKTPSEFQFDVILKVKTDDKYLNIKNTMTKTDRTKYLGHYELFILKHIGGILRKGFSNRASLIVPILKPQNNINNITFGINLDQAEAFKILEKGPALHDPEERNFKEFWGELSTDRRFKDGSVNVAVYFKAETVKERRDIIKLIIEWLLKRHLNLPFTVFYNEFENVLLQDSLQLPYLTGTTEEASAMIISISDDLSKKLRALPLPLAINGVQGISSCFHGTDPSPPIAYNYKCGPKITSILENNIVMKEKIGVTPKYVKTVECVLQLEHSTKWPRDLGTFHHMKTAIYLEIAKQLARHHNLISQVQNDSLLVLYQGLVFRFHLYVPKEVGLLKKECNVNGAIVYKSSPASRGLVHHLVILPKLSGALRGLQAQWPSFGPTVGIAKRWMRTQMIDHHLFPDEVIDLLVAFVFRNCNGCTTPQRGFIAFLLFLREFQWQLQAVVVDFNEDITKEILADIDSKLLQRRDALPPLYLAVPYDNWESTLTKTAPCKEILCRVKQLAAESCSFYFKMIQEEDAGIVINRLFVANLDGYDALIQIRPLLNPVRHEQIAVSEAKREKIQLSAFDENECRKIPVVDFNPVQCFLQELRRNYGAFAEFFHDTYGGNVVGVLWKPKALEPMEFKVSHVNGRISNDAKLMVNVEALIEDFFILGKGIVKSIDAK